MVVEKNDFGSGSDFLGLGLYAFGTLGLEIVLAFLIEPFIFNKSFDNFTTIENILHWITTCVIWLIIAYALVRTSKKRYGFDIFFYRRPMEPLNRFICLGLLIIAIIISYINWEGFKIWKEFLNNGWLKFIFQYIYYFVETILFVLIVVFGQKAGEIWFGRGSIPWGGILVALTWGLAHIFTKGELMMGIWGLVIGLLYGLVYIVSKKNLFIAFPIIFLMFIL